MKELVADRDKHQWFTPTWAAEILISAHFPELTSKDIILEPTCGTGTFLKGVPAEIQAFGVELDPELAEIARKTTGRTVLTGDVTSINLPWKPTAIVGNPPFDLEVIDAILERSHDLLPKDGKVGFILPTYAFQTASRIVGYASRWSVNQEMIPRNLFRNMMKPLCFAVFKKDGLWKLGGFALYQELHDVNSMEKRVAVELSTTKSPWKEVITRIVSEMGGEAKLDEIYDAVAPKRPTGNMWWKAKVRQVLGRSGAFKRVSPSVWALAA